MKFNNAEKHLYDEIFTEQFLLKYGYYDISKTKEDKLDDINMYSKSDYFPTDIFNMDELLYFFQNFEYDSEIDLRTKTEPCCFSIPKDDISRRELKMPNIYSYLNLMYFILKKDNKEEIINKFMENKFSTSKYFGEFEFKYTVTEQIREMKLQSGNKMLKVDLSNFYHTVYTHTIPWIILGRDKAKNKYGKKMKDEKANNFLLEFSNNLDKLLENCQYGETHGVPTGNLLTRIVMEYYMCLFDEKMAKLYENVRYSRYVDDIQFNFSSEHQKNNFLSALRFNCREYYLNINENKTKIEEYPFKHIRDKKEIFSYFDNCDLKSYRKNKIIDCFSKFCDFCETQEAMGNKGAIKCVFPVILRAIKENNLSSDLVSKLFFTYNNLSNFNLYEKLISLSLKDSKLTNKFIKFSKDIINYKRNTLKYTDSSEKISEIMNNFFKKNEKGIKESLSFYNDNKYEQERYQILIYAVYFNVDDFFNKEDLINLIDYKVDDYSLCLIAILYFRKFYKSDKKSILNKIENLLEETDKYYGNEDIDDLNKKFPVMAEKHWLFRYFMYSLNKNKIISDNDIKEVNSENETENMDDSNKGRKVRLNYKFVFKQKGGHRILKFYDKLLEENVKLISTGKNNNFRYL